MRAMDWEGQEPIHSKRNDIWFNGYISRRYGVDYNWLRNNISQHNSFELNDKEPYSDDTAIQTYIRHTV